MRDDCLTHFLPTRPPATGAGWTAIRLLLTTLISLSVPGLFTRAAAADFMLDPTFGIGGITRTAFGSNFTDTPNEILVQPDGMILTVGESHAGGLERYIAMSRHTADGVLDSAGFGDNGRVLVRFVFRDVAYAAALQPDGRIVAAGQQATSNASSEHVPATYRFLSSGTVDSTFNGTGFTSGRYDPVSSGDHAGVRVLPDGRIQSAGRSTANINGGATGFGFKRFLPSGHQVRSERLELPAFSLNRGSVVLDEGGRATWAQPYFVNGITQYVLARVDSNGVPDPGFGIRITGIAADPTHPPRLLRLPDGKLLLAGSSPEGGFFAQFTTVRFHSDGRVDSTFGLNGVTHTNISAGADMCLDAAVYPDGRLLLAGRTAIGSGQGALVRLLPDGALDSTFSDDGMQAVNLNGNTGTHYFTRVVLLPDQRVLAAGFDFAPNGGDFFLCRFGADQSGIESPARPPAVWLSEAYPNPTRAAVALRLELAREDNVRIDILDVAGRLVTTVHEGPFEAGSHVVRWDGRRTDSGSVSPGVYFARVVAGPRVETRRIVWAR